MSTFGNDLRGKRDIAGDNEITLGQALDDLIIGNVLGSNLFNSLVVGGFAGIAGSGELAGTFEVAIGFMLGTILLHLTGVLIGEVAKRYQYGLLVLRGAGVVSMVIGASFFLEAL